MGVSLFAVLQKFIAERDIEMSDKKTPLEQQP